MNDQPLKAIIIENEPEGRAALAQLCSRYPEWVQVVGEAAGVEEAVAMIQTLQPDLLLLDIVLSPGSGFDIMQHFQHPNFGVIFITAYQDYTVRAIRASAIDYLLKPIFGEDLLAALQRAKQQLQFKTFRDQQQVLMGNLQAANASTTPKEASHISRLALPTQEGFKIIVTEDLVALLADRNYTELLLRNGEKIVASKPLKHFDQILCESGFFRCHQSWLINLQYAKEYRRRKKGGIILTQNGLEIPLAESARTAFMSLFA